MMEDEMDMACSMHRRVKNAWKSLGGKLERKRMLGMPRK
jgi:hypothetical protein